MRMLWNKAGSESPVLLLAHGAGAPMDSDFMDLLAEKLCDERISVARFEFPYMERRREDGKKRPPDRQPVLFDAFRQAASAAGGLENIFIGGKSLGGRMASLLASEAACRGVACFGYPFHPPGKPEQLRTAHLASITTPVLVCQGERDHFGRREEVIAYSLAQAVSLHWLPDGDHDFKSRKSSGIAWEDNVTDAACATAAWLNRYAR